MSWWVTNRGQLTEIMQTKVGLWPDISWSNRAQLHRVGKSNRAWFLTWGRFLKKRTNREWFLTWVRSRMRSVPQNNLLILDGYLTNNWLIQDWHSADMLTDMSTDILVNTKRSNFFLRVTHKHLWIKAKSYLFIPLFSTHTTLWVCRHIVQGHQRCGILNNDVIFISLSIWV